jgi:hypothetical protein
VLEQLQQQQQLPSPGRPKGSTPASSSSGGRSGFGQQPLFKPRNAACTDWQQQLEQRRRAAPGGRLFLDDLMSAAQHAARLPDSSPALAYPYPDVLTCINTLFVSAGSSSGSEAWHAKLSLLLYYLLDGGWLGSAEPFAQVRLCLYLCVCALLLVGQEQTSIGRRAPQQMMLLHSVSCLSPFDDMSVLAWHLLPPAPVSCRASNCP